MHNISLIMLVSYDAMYHVASIPLVSERRGDEIEESLDERISRSMSIYDLLSKSKKDDK